MKMRLPVRKHAEPQAGLYLLSALMFAALYGLPLLAYLLGHTQQ